MSDSAICRQAGMSVGNSGVFPVLVLSKTSSPAQTSISAKRPAAANDGNERSGGTVQAKYVVRYPAQKEPGCITAHVGDRLKGL